MTTDEFLAAVAQLDTELRSQGFDEESNTHVLRLARQLANSTSPLQVLTAWLNRTPEARRVLDQILKDPPKISGAAMEVGGKSPQHVFSHCIFYGNKEGAKVAPASAVSSATAEQVIGQSREVAPEAEAGRFVRGASAPSKTVNVGNAAESLASFSTRPVNPGDFENPGSLGEIPPLRGGQPIKRADGTTLVACAWFPEGQESVEFLDKKGPILLMRIRSGKREGVAVPGPIEFVHPISRLDVLEAFALLPGTSESEFNFNPFEGAADPWAAKE